MSAPAGPVTVCALNVVGSEGCISSAILSIVAHQGKVEQQYLAGFRISAGQRQLLLPSYGGSIAGMQGEAIHCDHSSNHVHPCGTIRAAAIRNLGSFCQFRHEHASVLVDSGCSVPIRWPRQALQPILLLLRVKTDLLITRLRSLVAGSIQIWKKCSRSFLDGLNLLCTTPVLADIR